MTLAFYIIFHLQQEYTDIDDLSPSVWIVRDTMLGEKTTSVFLGVLATLFNLEARGGAGASIGHLKFLHAHLTINLV